MLSESGSREHAWSQEGYSMFELFEEQLIAAGHGGSCL
jgi:hypothetical protein